MMTEYNKNQFAKFLFNIGLSINNYNYDLIYDIGNIRSKETETIKRETEKNDNRYPTKDKVLDTMYLFTRSNGTHSFFEGENINTLEEIKMYKDHNEKMYKIVFCWNEGYFSNTEHCTIEEIKY